MIDVLVNCMCFCPLNDPSSIVVLAKYKLLAITDGSIIFLQANGNRLV